MKSCFRLTKNYEFINVYRAGRRWSCPFFTMYVVKNHLERTRLGVSVSKRIGKSVVRNKVKRRIKEIIRQNMDNIKRGYDIVISAKPDIVKCDYEKIKKEIINFLRRGRIWYDKKRGSDGDNLL